jgi:hypothetical protein
MVYETITEAVQDLRRRGFTIDFNNGLESKRILYPEDFLIKEIYRFEGDTNPSDEDILYAICSKKGDVCGIYTDAYGAYSDGNKSEFLSKLPREK